MRHKDVFMENWITQHNTRAGPNIQSRWWKGKEKACVNATFYQQVGRRAFMTSTQQRGLISFEGVPCGQDRTEGCASPRSSQSFKPSQERHRQQQQISLLTEAHAALKLSKVSHNKSMRNPACFKSTWFWFIINNNNVHLQKMQSRLLMAEALGKKKIWSSCNILKLIPYISAF